MTQKITGEAPFQVLATNFSISPSLQNYVLQISADGTNYSDLFTVSAGVTKMVTNVANGSYYRLKNNNSEVTINWRTQCNDGQGGGSISGGSADYATLAGESNKTKLLEGGSSFPQSANTGDVVAVAPTPTRGGAKSGGNTLGIYQYDGSDWNKIEGGSGSGSSYEPYKIELSSVDPQYYTQQDRETLIDFYTAFDADTSIADSAYIFAVDGIYRCVKYIPIPNSPIFTFEGTYNDNIVDIWLHFSDGRFSYGSLQNAVPTPPTPEITSLKPASDYPEDPVEGEIVSLSGEAGVDYRPEAPNGQTVYGGNLTDFMDAVKGTSNNELWVNTWDDAGHIEMTNQGYFHLESDAIDFYDYQGDIDYLYNDLNEGEWVDANTICLWKEGKNLYFYVKQEAEGVFFPDTDSTMEFETMVYDNLVNQYDNGEWKIFPQVLYSRGEFPKVAEFGDVVGIGKYEDREATSADVFTSATVTMVNGRATFKMYNPNYGGYCDEYTFGYDENEGIIGGWGGENNVINGPWNDQGVEFSINGDDITFTTQNPENTEEALQMWGFEPNCNDRITTKELGIYQRDEEGWVKIGEGGAGESDFIHLDNPNTAGEVGKTYEFEGRIMQWVEGSGYTAEWLSNIANIDNEEGTGLIYSTIPDGQKLFEYKYSYGGEWRYVIYSGGTLYCTETGGTVVSSATIGQTFIFQTQSQSNYQVKGYFENGHIGFVRIGYVSVQNVWDGNAANSHYELINKYNYPYTNVQSNGVEVGIAKWNKYGQVVKKQGGVSTKAIQFNTNASQYSSTGKITFYTDGTNNGPDKIYVPTEGGTSGQVLVSNGDNAAPTFQSWIKVVKITSDAYDALVQAGTTDPNTLYAIVDE